VCVSLYICEFVSRFQCVFEYYVLNTITESDSQPTVSFQIESLILLTLTLLCIYLKTEPS